MEPPRPRREHLLALLGVREAERPERDAYAYAVPAQPAPDYAEILAAVRDGRFARFRSLEEANAYVDELRQDRDDVAP